MNLRYILWVFVELNCKAWWCKVLCVANTQFESKPSFSSNLWFFYYHYWFRSILFLIRFESLCFGFMIALGNARCTKVLWIHDTSFWTSIDEEKQIVFLIKSNQRWPLCFFFKKKKVTGFIPTPENYWIFVVLCQKL